MPPHNHRRAAVDTLLPRADMTDLKKHCQAHAQDTPIQTNLHLLTALTSGILCRHDTCPDHVDEVMPAHTMTAVQTHASAHDRLLQCSGGSQRRCAAALCRGSRLDSPAGLTGIGLVTAACLRRGLSCRPCRAARRGSYGELSACWPSASSSSGLSGAPWSTDRTMHQRNDTPAAADTRLRRRDGQPAADQCIACHIS